MTTISNRNNALDGLRGLAALIVAIGHCNLTLTGLRIHAATLDNLSSLNAGELRARLFYLIFNQDAMVVLFFMLSGHVLGLALRQRATSPLMEVMPYLVRRICRLLPVGIIAALPFLYLAPQAPLRQIVETMVFYDRSLNGVIWSLQVEIFGSLLIFALWALRWRWLAMLSIPVFVGLILTHQSTSFVIQYMPAFALGYLIRSGIRLPKWIICSGVVLAVIVLMGTDLLIGHGIPLGYLQTLAAFVIVGALVNWPQSIGARLLSSRPIHFLGLVSYPFYLLHPAAVQITAPLIQGHWAGMSMMMRVAELSMVSVVTGLSAAWVAHKLVEQPGIRLGQVIGRWVAGVQDRVIMRIPPQAIAGSGYGGHHV